MARDHCVLTPSQHAGEENTQINLLSITCPVQFQRGSGVVKVGGNKISHCVYYFNVFICFVL